MHPQDNFADAMKTVFPQAPEPEYRMDHTGHSLKFLDLELVLPSSTEDVSVLFSTATEILEKIQSGFIEQKKRTEMEQEDEFNKVEQARNKNSRQREAIMSRTAWKKPKRSVVNEGREIECEEKGIEQTYVNKTTKKNEGTSESLTFLNGMDYQSLVGNAINGTVSVGKKDEKEAGETTPSYYDDDYVPPVDTKLEVDPTITIPSIEYFTAAYNSAISTGFVGVLRNACKFYLFDFPEFEIVRENNVFVCTATFLGFTFTSPYLFDKAAAKEYAAQQACDYLKDNWNSVLSRVSK